MQVKINVSPGDLAIDPNCLQLLKQVGEKTLRNESVAKAELSILLLDNAGMRGLNKKWRGIDAPTDVLSFPLLQGDDQVLLPAEVQLLGDVVISVEQALKQAREQGHSLEYELAFLLTHGVLHLLGYDHQTDIQERQMWVRQQEILTGLEFNN